MKPDQRISIECFDLEYPDGTRIHVRGNPAYSEVQPLAKAAGAEQVRVKARKIDGLGFLVGIVELLGL